MEKFENTMKYFILENSFEINLLIDKFFKNQSVKMLNMMKMNGIPVNNEIIFIK